MKKRTSIEEIEKYYASKINRSKAQYIKNKNNAIHLFHLGINKKQKIETKRKNRKNEAYKWFQLYSRLIRSNSEGDVLQVDTGKTVHYTECDGGHLRPKKNFPILAFTIENVRPISSRCNQLQGDQFGYERCDKVKNIIGEKAYTMLEKTAKQKIKMTNKQYGDIAEKYKNLCLDICDKFGFVLSSYYK